MKANFLCFKISKTILLFCMIIIIQLIFIIIGLKQIIETKSFEQMNNDVKKIEQVNENTIVYKESNTINNQITVDNNVQINKVEEKLEEYKNMPREFKGYTVIGKIDIPKINLSSYILSETNTKSLKASVTKLYGPEINKIGNFCIAGHNYKNGKMFGCIKKLEKGDEIILTDTYDRGVKYEVYDVYKISPKDLSCLNQNTNSEREVTLITCTTGAIKRVIVKAIEVYD